MKRAIVMALSVILALTMAAPTVLAQAGPPGDASGAIELAANDERFPGACDFRMLLEFSGKAKTIELPDEGGVVFTSISTSPGLDVTITNLDNPENQATFNITGPVFSSTDPESGDLVTMVTGRNLLIDPEAGTVIAIGDFSFVFDRKGNLVQPLEGEGQLIDLCALLE